MIRAITTLLMLAAAAAGINAQTGRTFVLKNSEDGVSELAPLDVRPNFSILFYPVITMDEKNSHQGSVNNFLGKRKSDAASVRRFSADQQVNHYATPPALVILSNDDKVVPPVTNGIAYYAAMRRVGNECTLHVYSDGGHGYGFATWFKHREQMLSDLDSWLSHHKAPQREVIHPEP